MTVRVVVLSIHVLCGSLWIGGSACFALAAAVLERGSSERREFAVRAAAPINRINLGAAFVVVMTGMTNLWFVSHLRHFVLPPAFIRVLLGKVTLYGLMVLALWESFAAERKMKQAYADGDFDAVTTQTGRLATFCGLTAMMGIGAVVLGIWLAGT